MCSRFRLSTARALAGLLAGRGALEPALRLPIRHAARVLKRDLEAAGIPYRDESERVFDFHGLRGMTASRLLAAGANPRTAQALMRHSTADLTLSVYARLRPGDERAALDLLPDLVPDDRESAQTTGTYGASYGALPLRNDEDPSEQKRISPGAEGPSGAIASEGMARTTGLEPATPGVTGRYSNRLSYVPALGREV